LLERGRDLQARGRPAGEGVCTKDHPMSYAEQSTFWGWGEGALV
jgi:hypothetical protein